jgi:hypothetical protein
MFNVSSRKMNSINDYNAHIKTSYNNCVLHHYLTVANGQIYEQFYNQELPLDYNNIPETIQEKIEEIKFCFENNKISYENAKTNKKIQKIINEQKIVLPKLTWEKEKVIREVLLDILYNTSKRLVTELKLTIE